jgi:hypothetical protein
MKPTTILLYTLCAVSLSLVLQWALNAKERGQRGKTIDEFMSTQNDDMHPGHYMRELAGVLPLGIDEFLESALRARDMASTLKSNSVTDRLMFDVYVSRLRRLRASNLAIVAFVRLFHADWLRYVDANLLPGSIKDNESLSRSNDFLLSVYVPGDRDMPSSEMLFSRHRWRRRLLRGRAKLRREFRRWQEHHRRTGAGYVDDERGAAARFVFVETATPDDDIDVSDVELMPSADHYDAYYAVVERRQSEEARSTPSSLSSSLDNDEQCDFIRYFLRRALLVDECTVHAEPAHDILRALSMSTLPAWLSMDLSDSESAPPDFQPVSVTSTGAAVSRALGVQPHQCTLELDQINRINLLIGWLRRHPIVPPVKLPDGVQWAHAGNGPRYTAAHAHDIPVPHAGGSERTVKVFRSLERIIVVGGGPVGLMMALQLRWNGFANVVVLDQGNGIYDRNHWLDFYPPPWSTAFKYLRQWGFGAIDMQVHLSADRGDLGTFGVEELFRLFSDDDADVAKRSKNATVDDERQLKSRSPISMRCQVFERFLAKVCRAVGVRIKYQHDYVNFCVAALDGLPARRPKRWHALAFDARRIKPRYRLQRDARLPPLAEHELPKERDEFADTHMERATCAQWRRAVMRHPSLPQHYSKSPESLATLPFDHLVFADGGLRQPAFHLARARQDMLHFGNTSITSAGFEPSQWLLRASLENEHERRYRRQQLQGQATTAAGGNSVDDALEQDGIGDGDGDTLRAAAPEDFEALDELGAGVLDELLGHVASLDGPYYALVANFAAASSSSLSPSSSDDKLECPAIASRRAVELPWDIGFALDGVHAVFRRFRFGHCHMHVIFKEQFVRERLRPLATAPSIALPAVPYDVLLDIANYYFEAPLDSVEALREALVPAGSSNPPAAMIDLGIGAVPHAPIIVRDVTTGISIMGQVGDAEVTSYHRLGVGINSAFTSTRKMSIMYYHVAAFFPIDWPRTEREPECQAINHIVAESTRANDRRREEIVRYQLTVMYLELHCNYVIFFDADSQHFTDSWLAYRRVPGASNAYEGPLKRDLDLFQCQGSM